MKKKKYFLMLSILLTSSVLFGCGSDGSDPLAAPNPNLDLTGNWSYVATTTASTCPGEILNVPSPAVSINVLQNGATITVEDSASGEVIATGTLTGNEIVGFPLETYAEDNGTTTETSQTFIVDTSGDIIDATINWSWTDGVFTCTGTDTVVVTRELPR